MICDVVLHVLPDTSDATVPRPSLHSTISLDDTVSLDGRRGSEVERETILDGVEEDTDSVFQLLPDDSEWPYTVTTIERFHCIACDPIH